MLDEPTNGLDPAGISDMRGLIKSLPERSGTTVFVSSHQLSEIEQMADHCALIKSGQLLFQGRLDALMAQAYTSFFIETNNTERALAMAIQAGLDATGLAIHSPLDPSARSELIGAIIRAGGEVSQAFVRETSLEALFLSLTNNDERAS
jgi:ABC-2 type transport system ATP-binding protein